MTVPIIDCLTHISTGPDDVIGWGPCFLAEDLLAQMDAPRKVFGQPQRVDKAIVFPSLALTVPTGPNLSPEDRIEAQRRFDIIEPLIDRDKFALLYTQHPRVSQIYAYLAKQHKVKTRTLYRWLQAWKAGGYPALVRKDRADKGSTPRMNEAARELLIKLGLPLKPAEA